VSTLYGRKGRGGLTLAAESAQDARTSSWRPCAWGAEGGAGASATNRSRPDALAEPEPEPEPEPTCAFVPLCLFGSLAWPCVPRQASAARVVPVKVLLRRTLFRARLDAGVMTPLEYAGEVLSARIFESLCTPLILLVGWNGRGQRRCSTLP
jgi:hypothetical protein